MQQAIRQITLTEFVDFVAATGTQRITKVREIQERPDYDPRFDFWKKLRDTIVTFHREGKPRAFLDGALDELRDLKKVQRYPALVTSYKRFLGRKEINWFDPPAGVWSHGQLSVRINPELGLVIAGTPHLVKLYFKSEPLSKRRVEVILHLLEQWAPLMDGTRATPAVLDVPKGKLIPMASVPTDLGILLDADAYSFVLIWQGIRTLRGRR